ncbi:MAG TPA: cation-translocating P-type ATPase C-terminal domain-containing protein, partial [Bacteroidia bacterium]
VMAICLAVFFIAIYLQRPENEVRALTFTTLIVANLGLILINRSWTRSILETFKKKNAAVKWVVGGAAIILAMILLLPGLRTLFHFDVLHIEDIAICFVSGVISILWFELMKSRKNILPQTE